MTEVAVGNADGLLAEVRDTAWALIAPDAASIDRESRFPDAQLNALGQLGALGRLVPHEQGGVGAGSAALAEACEAVGGVCLDRNGVPDGWAATSTTKRDTSRCSPNDRSREEATGMRSRRPSCP
jgi:Acyl-CoA dehydrogenase, N-terminal domain